MGSGGKSKKSYLMIILLPLLTVMVFQALLSYGTIEWSGTVGQLNNNNVTLLEQNTVNKKISLQNEMLQRWSNLDEVAGKIGDITGRILDNREVTVSEMTQDPVIYNEWLELVSRQLLYELRIGSVAGSFVVLDNGSGAEGAGEPREFAGLYFRDLDPSSNPADYTDILCERGPASIASGLNIPLDSYWTSQFRYQPGDKNDRMEYFYKPFQAAIENPGMSYRDMGYWSDPFLLQAGSLADAEPFITYSVPLLSDGKPYGVFGVGVTKDMISKLLPSADIDKDSRGGFLLAASGGVGREPQPGLNCTVKLAVGSAMEGLAEEYPEMMLTESEKYKGLYRAEGVSLYDSPVYVKAYPLNLYNNNTPFSGTTWMVLGTANSDMLFGGGNQLRERFLIAVGLSLLIGIIGICLVSRHTTRPITRLADRIKIMEPDQVFEAEPTNVREIDDLSEVIHRLTCVQKDIENKLNEERERYLIALESTADVIIEYEKKEDRFIFYDILKEGEGEPEVMAHTFENFTQMVEKGLVVHPDDVDKLLDFLNGRGEEQVTIRIRSKQDGDEYSWYTAKGKSIYDDNREFVRMIGNTRNITREKEEEFRRLEESRRDHTTRFYRREAGEGLVKEYLQYKPEEESCVFAILDLDRFRDLNDKYGMLYCDILLEEAAGIVHRIVREKDILIRYGGNQLAILFPATGDNEGSRLTEAICSQIRTIYTGEDETLSMGCSAGMDSAGKRADYASLISHAQLALQYTKKYDRGGAGFYSEIKEKDEAAELSSMRGKKPGPVSSNYYDEEDNNIITFLYNVFEKTHDVKSAVQVLMGKIGREFHLGRILILNGDPELCVNHILYQWAQPGTDCYSRNMEHFTEQEYGQGEALFAHEDMCVIDAEHPFVMKDSKDGRDILRRLLRRYGEKSACYCTMYDNGEYFGTILFEAADEERVWSGKEKEAFVEICHIISTHLSKSRSDLASKAKGEFLSRMSHEIRTPMNAIIGMTLIAQGMEDTPAKVRECLDKIDNSAKYLLGIINDILDMSRIESGKMKLENSGFDIRGIAEELDTLMRPQAEGKEQKFDIRLEVEKPYLVGDSLRLNQVLVNLVSNAVKFTPPSGSITVKIRQLKAAGGTAKLAFSVQDSGIGIGEESRLRIFDAFEQAGDDTARQYGGTGLGLAISSNLVKMMGGRLEVDSREGEGSRFYFTVSLPISEKGPDSSEEKKEDMAAYRQRFSGKRILIAEDNELNREIEQTILENTGFLIETAVDGQQAVDTFRDSAIGHYDVVLMDIRMPKLDGLEATRAIRTLKREDARTIPIIAMTANAFDEDTKKSIESGMNGHLSKPIDVKRLYEVLAQVLS